MKAHFKLFCLPFQAGPIVKRLNNQHWLGGGGLKAGEQRFIRSGGKLLVPASGFDFTFFFSLEFYILPIQSDNGTNFQIIPVPSHEP